MKQIYYCISTKGIDGKTAWLSSYTKDYSDCTFVSEITADIVKHYSVDLAHELVGSLYRNLRRNFEVNFSLATVEVEFDIRGQIKVATVLATHDYPISSVMSGVQEPINESALYTEFISRIGDLP